MENCMGNEVASFLQELRVKPLDDFHCLKTFHSGVETMDSFIRNDFRLSVENHYCSAYIVLSVFIKDVDLQPMKFPSHIKTLSECSEHFTLTTNY